MFSFKFIEDYTTPEKIQTGCGTPSYRKITFKKGDIKQGMMPLGGDWVDIEVSSCPDLSLMSSKPRKTYARVPNKVVKSYSSNGKVIPDFSDQDNVKEELSLVTNKPIDKKKSAFTVLNIGIGMFALAGVYFGLKHFKVIK